MITIPYPINENLAKFDKSQSHYANASCGVDLASCPDVINFIMLVVHYYKLMNLQWVDLSWSSLMYLNELKGNRQAKSLDVSKKSLKTA